MIRGDRPEASPWRSRANSFGAAATLYDRVRPGYPVESIQWALRPLGAGGWRVADIGAGTGIMTRQLLGLGHMVIAIEPDELMLRRLATGTAGAFALVGIAEAVPLRRASVDAVVAAQAYHWFDPDRAHRELARVLRPAGVFAAIWNDLDESVGWVAELSRIIEGDADPGDAGAHTGRARKPHYGARFGPVRSAEFRHRVRHTPDSLVDLVRTGSYFLTADRIRQAQLEAELRRLLARHPDVRGRTGIELPYRTVVCRASRLT